MDIILYLSNGYPTIEASIQMAKEYADAGCHIIEVDFPAKDPFLESKLIADRMKHALEQCSDYDRYMDEIIQIHKMLPDVKIVLLAYQETIKEIGVEKYIRFCKENGFTELLMTGITPEGGIKEKLIEAGLSVTCYVQFQMLENEIQDALHSNGFVYMQAKPAPGQGYTNPKYPTLKDCINGLREAGIDRPIYCGVGVHSPEDVKMVKEAGGDAAFVGSAILNLQDDIPAMKERIKEFAAQCE